MGAHVEVRRGIRSASGRAELWRGLRRRLDEYSLTLRLLLKRPLAAAGLLITLLYVGIAIAASFLPDRDVLQTNFTTALKLIDAPRMTISDLYNTGVVTDDSCVRTDRSATKARSSLAFCWCRASSRSVRSAGS